MKISVRQGGKVNLKFKGKINMAQEIILSKTDAQKLGKILVSKKSSSFETE